MLRFIYINRIYNIIMHSLYTQRFTYIHNSFPLLSYVNHFHLINNESFYLFYCMVFVREQGKSVIAGAILIAQLGGNGDIFVCHSGSYFHC